MHTSRPAPPSSQPRHTHRRTLFARPLLPLALGVIVLLLGTTALARASAAEVPPAPVTLSPPNGSTTTNNRPTVSGTAEAGSTVTVYVDNTASGNVTADASGNWSYTLPSNLADGSHTVKARASNISGSSVDSNTNTFIVDTTPPPAPVTISPNNGATITDSTPTVSGSAEANSTVMVYIDGALSATVSANVAGTWSHTPATALSDGSHTAKARATDSAGNQSVDSNTNTFTVDSSAPETEITSAPPAVSASASAGFSFSGSDGAGSGVAGFECALDSGGFAACSSPQTYSGLAAGSHSFAVRARDTAGNVDPSPASHTWTVALSPPLVTAITPGASPTSAALISFTVLFDQPVSGVDGGDFALSVGGGIGGASIAGVAGSGATWTVTVNTGAGSGTIGLDLDDNDSISSTESGLALGGAGADNGDFSGGVATIVKAATIYIPRISRSGN